MFELNEIYAEMGQRCATDFDERNTDDNGNLNILEGRGIQIFLQNYKDWHYRSEDRRWVVLNDKTGWRKAELEDGKLAVSVFHLR